MRKQTFLSTILITLLSTLSGCEIIGGIFKTGMGIGVIITIIVVGLVIFLFSKMRGNK
ncbi:MAG: hypothetical protein K0M40_05875 [Prolixibacteraceae bacterium]|nr:hypothetical protein [Prolixibacteraceae bacterium]